MFINHLTKAFLLCMLCSFAYAQQSPESKIDSLEKWIKAYPKKDTVWVKNLLELERAYYIHEPPKVGKYAAEIINTSKKLNFFHGVAKGYTALIHHYIQKGKYQEAIKTVYEKLKYVEKSKDFFEISNAYSLLGYIHKLIGKNDQESIKYYQIAYEYTKKLPLNDNRRTTRLTGDLSNLALIYTRIEKHEKSLTLLLEANELALEITPKDIDYYFLLTAIQVNIGNTYYFLDKYELSNYYLNQVVRIVDKHKINISLPRVYLALSRNYIELKQFEKADEMLHAFSKHSNNLDVEERGLLLKFKTQIQEGRKDFAQAFAALKDEIAFQDSLKTHEQQKIIKELSVKYETEKKEVENKYLSEVNEKISTQNRFYLAVALLMLVFLAITTILYYRLRQSGKKLVVANQHLQEANETKDSLFRMIAHDLKTPATAFVHLTHAMNYLLKKKDAKKLEQLTQQAEFLANDLQSITNNLLYWSMLRQGSFSFLRDRVYLTDIVEELRETLKTYSELRSVKLEIVEDQNLTLESNRLIIITVLRNLLSNALKFTDDNGTVRLSIVQKNTEVVMQIEDSGIGFTQANLQHFEEHKKLESKAGLRGEKGTGLGLAICQQLITQCAGTLHLGSSPDLGGAFVTVTLPIQ